MTPADTQTNRAAGIGQNRQRSELHD